MLENATIRLRALEPDDLDLLMRWENDPQTWRVSNTLAPYSRYVLRRYLEQSADDIFTTRQLKLVVVDKASSAAVGLVDLFDFEPYHRRAEIGVLVDAAFRRQGIATEAVRLTLEYAFGHLHLHQVYCHVDENNTASCEMFLKAGFTQGGALKDWVCTGDGYCNALLLQAVNSL